MHQCVLTFIILSLLISEWIAWIVFETSKLPYFNWVECFQMNFDWWQILQKKSRNLNLINGWVKESNLDQNNYLSSLLFSMVNSLNNDSAFDCNSIVDSTNFEFEGNKPLD